MVWLIWPTSTRIHGPTCVTFGGSIQEHYSLHRKRRKKSLQVQHILGFPDNFPLQRLEDINVLPLLWFWWWKTSIDFMFLFVKFVWCIFSFLSTPNWKSSSSNAKNTCSQNILMAFEKSSFHVKRIV